MVSQFLDHHSAQRARTDESPVSVDLDPLDGIPAVRAKLRRVAIAVHFGLHFCSMSRILYQRMNERRNFGNFFGILEIVKLQNGQKHAAAEELFRPCDVVAEFLNLIGKGS
jgi:hypothetical protein